MNMKKLGVILVGGIILISGCHQQAPDKVQTTHEQPVKQVCTYNNVDEGAMGSYTASEPIKLINGKTFSFNKNVEFNIKKVGVIDEKDMLLGVVTKDESLCMYEIDVTGKQGWDKLENPNNVYQVDSVERENVLAYDLYQMGLPIDTEVNKMVHVTHIKGHLVHTHTKECK